MVMIYFEANAPSYAGGCMAGIDIYYKALGIRSAASLDDIKKAFLEKEQGLQRDFESEDPEKRVHAREKLNEIYEAHEKVVRHFMEHGPPKFQEEVEERISVREAQVSGAPEPIREPGGVTPEQEEQTEEKAPLPPESRSERLLAHKTVSLLLIVSLTILFAVSVGSLIGVVAFRHTAKKTAPSQPLRQVAMTTATPYHPPFSKVSSVERHDRAEEAAERNVPGEKRRNKKVAKAGKHKAAKPVSRITRQSLENTMNAAKQGDAEAQYRLGTMYSKGVGVRKDTAEAMKWYRRAASRGHAKAKENLEYVYE
jgi:hypothetical protein